MKFFLSFLALVATMLMGANAYREIDYAWTCYKQNPLFYKAAGDFCIRGGDNLQIPSTFASQGVKYSGHLAFITGTCNPSSWVPQDICRLQFFRMCATGINGGQKMKFFGPNKCQKWELFRYQ